MQDLLIWFHINGLLVNTKKTKRKFFFFHFFFFFHIPTVHLDIIKVFFLVTN